MRERSFRVRNIYNGEIYTLGENKIRKESPTWEIWTFEMEEAAREREEAMARQPVAPAPTEDMFGDPIEAEKPKHVLTRDEMKTILDAKDVPYKGNASNETLLALVNEE